MNYILLFLLGVLVGAIAMLIVKKFEKTAGTFVMDFSDPLKDICRLELSEDLNVIYTKKRISLKIEAHEYNSHE